MSHPSVGILRSVLPEQSRLRSTFKGVLLFLSVFSLYVMLFGLALAVNGWWYKLILGLLSGLAFSILFVIGHDACHDSLTPSSFLNAMIARIAFLPSLHPYVTWELGHNRLHHGWTNLKGVDYVYTPFSKAEFDALPATRRLMERVYRTVLGSGLFYMIEVWWNHLIWPPPADRSKLDKRQFILDLSYVIIFFAAECTLAFFTGPAVNPMQQMLNVFAIVLAPYFFFNWLMAFITLQHHTHPSVAWFSTREEWDFFNGQVRGTVHVKMPRLFEFLFQNILEHTAHHVDPKIPLYQLAQCQKTLENHFAEDITVEKGSIFQFHKNLKSCQLYDYQQHRWLRFDGTPTTGPLLSPSSV